MFILLCNNINFIHLARRGPLGGVNRDHQQSRLSCLSLALAGAGDHSASLYSIIEAWLLVYSLNKE